MGQRASTSRHAAVNSISRYTTPHVSSEMLDLRNKTLGISDPPVECFYCQSTLQKDVVWDHFVPCCNTKDKVYGYRNDLNLFPACRTCNTAKSGKKPDDWIPRMSRTEEVKACLRSWMREWYTYLHVSPACVRFLESEFELINRFHAESEARIRDFTNRQPLGTYL